jgi:hypothetical protein
LSVSAKKLREHARLIQAGVTLQDLLNRSEPDGECLVWTGYCQAGRFPTVSIAGATQPVRRVAYALVHGPIMQGLQVGVLPDCAPNCWHVDHLVARTKSSVHKGKPKSQVHRLHITESRQRRTKLTWEAVREIRASALSAPEEAQARGLSRHHVWQIRAYRVWQEAAGPFGGLVMRAGRAA